MTGNPGDRSTRRSGLTLAVLALLAEAPMHPYRMQQLVKDRGKDTVVNVAHRNSVNQAVERLLRDGQIEVEQVRREGNWPERTVYRITEQGTVTLRRWMQEMLSGPAREFPELPAALSFAALFSPEEVRSWLETRLQTVRDRLAASAGQGAVALPRVLLVEEEYKRAILAAEACWLRSIVDDLRSGQLAWDPDRLRVSGPETGQ